MTYGRRMRLVDPALVRTGRISGHGFEAKDTPEVVGRERLDRGGTVRALDRNGPSAPSVQRIARSGHGSRPNIDQDAPGPGHDTPPGLNSRIGIIIARMVAPEVEISPESHRDCLRTRGYPGDNPWELCTNSATNAHSGS